MDMFSVCLVLTVLVTSVSTAFVRSVSNSTLLTFLKGDSFTRNGRRCHDFCTPDWCNNGGTCYTDETTCIGSCVCTAFYTGSRCQTKRFVDPAILNSFLDALDSRSDKNNRLVKDSKRTNNSTTISSRVLAMLHGIAHIEDRHDTEDHSLAIVHDNLNHIGHESETDHANITTQESRSHNLSMNDCLITCNNGDCIKINDKYKCKHRINGTLTLQERTCGPGFVCVHGVCDLEAKRNNSYDCICESNYVGQFCDYECPFDCGHHGFCDYDVSDSSYKCFCQWNYTGYNCSELIPIETGQFCDYECPFDCGHHGFCDYDVSDSSYKCFCQWNYTGYNCSELIPIETGQFCDYECPFDCGHHIFCDYDVSDSSYKCFCQWNYTGYNCSELIPIETGQFCDYECPFDCGHHGFYDNDVSDSSYKCFCQWNYTGYNCSELIPIETGQFCDYECPFDCGHHGFCDYDVSDSSYKCFCQWNYTGYNCSELIPIETGQFCDYECPFDCGHHGFCDYDVSDSSYKCFCQWNYTGYNCSELIPIETELLTQPRRHTFHWYVLGASVTIVFLIVVGTFLAGYFLWKRRLVFVLKIVHFFQEYEDDDGKEFDAFVSYKSTERDEKFVLTQLFPRLEGSSRFKLCLHFRDFEPGEAIANNIVRAIENSRRTIMILSPAYVKSEWCRMEYQKAQHEMLKLKHKIIPIVLEDISEVRDMDTNLKSILDSVTYLQWPGSDSEKKVEKFWTKLELSLPKKSSLSSSSSTSELSSPLSDMSDLSGPITSESVPSDSDIPSCKHKPPLTLSISSETDSSTQDSIDLRKSSKRSERRKKTFRHFIDRFVCSRSSFSRQDSSSSQTALVDEETVGSRSSCDSMSESNLTESTESICSTPGTANTYLDDTTGVACEPSSYFSVCVDRNAICLDSKEEKADQSEKDQCDLFHSDQRSLHRVGMRGNSCLTVVSENKGKLKLNESGESIDECNIDVSEMCELCKIANTGSDNNRVKITTVEGSDQIRIQKLMGSRVKCKHCNSKLARDSGYRGSLKNRKEAVNRELSLLNRSGTLPRNFRSQILARAIQECDEGSIYSDRATICENDAGSRNISKSFDTATFEQHPDVVIDLDLGNSLSCNGISRYMDVYESI